MNEKLVTLIFNAVSTLGAVGIACFGLLQYGLNYNERKLKETIAKAKENSTGQEALSRLLESHEAVRRDMSEMDKEVSKLKEDMFNEKKELQTRLEKLRDHFEEMTRDYFKILSNK